jgi:hypothetical protein
VNSEATHRGCTLHVQTEDSGAAHPHVITHLFADGGRIVATRKTSYLAWVGQSDCASLVRFLIRLQHKTMLSSLKSGAYDGHLALGGPAETKQEPSLDLDAVRELHHRALSRANPQAESTPCPTSTEARFVAESSSAVLPRHQPSQESASELSREIGQHMVDQTTWMADDLDEIIAESLAAALERPPTSFRQK